MKTLILEGARALGISMTEVQAECFEKYHAMLIEANARMNLTRVPDDPHEAVDRNYLDCIAPLSRGFPDVSNAIDVGSGAGFPGIPLSIMLPDTRFTLIDALGKRAEFLQTVIDALALNAQVLHLRAEDAARRTELRERFDLATARAVAPMNVLCEYLLPFVRVGGHAMALKGPGVKEELERARNAITLLSGRSERVEALSVPGRDWNHCAAWLVKVAPTPDAYPRRAGLPEKKPLSG